MSRRRIAATALTFALIGATFSPTLAVAADGTAGDSQRLAPERCSWYPLNPTESVPAGTFGKCVADASLRASTAQYVSNNDGDVARGVIRYGRHTDVSLKMSKGRGVVGLGTRTWFKDTGKAWVMGRPGGSFEESQAHMIGALWRGLASVQSVRGALAASTTDWAPTGRTRKMNGVSASEYSGSPVHGDMTYTTYSVWIDSGFRPIRIESVGSAYGITTKTKQDFKKWGRSVAIKPPVGR